MRSLPKKIRRSSPLLGTFVEVELTGRAGMSILNDAINVGFDAVAQVDMLMSRHKPTSDLSLQTTTVFSDLCMVAEAHTKISLLSPPSIARRCIAVWRVCACVRQRRPLATDLSTVNE